MLTKATDRIIEMIDADPFVFADRESIIALVRMRDDLAHMLSQAKALRDGRPSSYGKPAPGTEVRIFSRAPSR
jgi:hypothetical protein